MKGLIPKWLRIITAAALVCSAGLIRAQDCDDTPTNDNGPIPPAYLSICPDPAFSYDLAIDSWDLVTHRSPDIRMGDAFSLSVPEKPRFFYDPGEGKFYTTLFSKFYNNGGCPAPALYSSPEVTVQFEYKTASSAADVYDGSAWNTIGTYQMNIKTDPAVLLPTFEHEQTTGTCWYWPPATTGSSINKYFPRKFIVRAIVNWTEQPATAVSNDTAYTFYDFEEIGYYSQIALALDLSGSMGIYQSPGKTRLKVAQEKAVLFTSIIEPGNQLGVYGFATDNPGNTSFSSTYIGTDNLSHTASLGQTSVISPMSTISSTTDWVPYAVAIGAQQDWGCTPIGQGLLRARKGMNDASPPAGCTGKAIVIFSDGLQNVKPFVNTTPSYTCGSYGPYAIIDAEHTFADEDITIYSIFYGDEVGEGYTLMNEIKDQTGGDYVYGTASEIELASIYYSIRGMVDDMIYLEENGTASVAEPWPVFEVNFDQAAKTATVAIAWAWDQGMTRLYIENRKKGTTNWQSLESAETSVQDSSSFRVYRFEPGPGTTWEFRVRQYTPRTGSTPYAAAVFSEVEDMKLSAHLEDTGFEAGQPLRICADLRTLGHPVAGASVKAAVRVPKIAFSNMMRDYSGKFSKKISPDPDQHKASVIVSQLKQFLKADGKPDELYPVNEVMVQMKDDGIGPDQVKGDGRYTGILQGSQTQVAGMVAVTVRAEGKTSTGRIMKRSTKLSTIANVGPADPARSQFVLSDPVKQADGSSIVTVTVYPTDKFGNAAFTGSGSNIRVTADGGKPKGDIKDNLESTFSQDFAVPSGKKLSNVRVKVGDVSIGKVIIGHKKHECSIHGGAAIPHGSFAKVADPGLCLSLDYAWALKPRFALRFETGISRFKAKFGDDQKILSNILCLQYRPVPGGFMPYVESGAGYYTMIDGDSGPGITAGAGIRIRLNRNWSMDLNANTHRVSGDLDVEFSQVRLGMICRF
ncbi:hypothetical protein JW948_10775 [bacterium]|nr:hypothetical protein [bacterium]